MTTSTAVLSSTVRLPTSTHSTAGAATLPLSLADPRGNATATATVGTAHNTRTGTTFNHFTIDELSLTTRRAGHVVETGCVEQILDLCKFSARLEPACLQTAV